MIDEQRTLEIYGYTSDELKPQSHKRVVAVCDICGLYRDLSKQDYRDVCKICIMGTEEMIEINRRSHIDQIVSDKTRKKISESTKGIPKSDFHKKAIQKALLTSLIHQKQIGGDDIVWHHVLYDHSDLLKNRVPMTRRNHSMGHSGLQKLGIEIPHINIEE